MRMEGDVGSQLVGGAQCRRVISAERSVGRNFSSVVVCGMWREPFDERFREWQEAVSGNNSPESRRRRRAWRHHPLSDGRQSLLFTRGAGSKVQTYQLLAYVIAMLGKLCLKLVPFAGIL